MIVAAADGSSLNNPGPSGWAWYINDDCWAADGWPNGTNNQGELRAVLDLLQQTAHLDEPLRVLCDSQYVINAVTRWLPGWKAKGWRKGDGKPVSNVDLLQAIDAELNGREVHFEWVKGHSGHGMNEAADARARAAATAVQQGQIVDRGPGFQPAALESVAVPAATTTGTANLVVPALSTEQESDQFDLFAADDFGDELPAEQLSTKPSGRARAGFIGAGHMGGAIARGAIQAGVLDAAGSKVHDPYAAAAERLEAETGIQAAASNVEAVGDVDLVVLAIKPVDYPAVIAEIRGALPAQAVVVSISPAHSLSALGELFGRDLAIARAMPNTPALIGKGTAGVCCNEAVSPQQRELVLELFGALGTVLELDEAQFPALTGVSGSSPAYVYMMIEALAQGAIKGGIAGPDAYRLAASAVEGAAAMVVQTGKHPAQLRDEVCSAGGTTIAAVAALEDAGFGGAVIAAVDAAARRAVEMGD